MTTILTPRDIEAVRSYGAPENINSDYGSQFTIDAFVAALTASRARLSMHGKGALTDNIFTERFWRSLKYEEVYVRAYDTVTDAKRFINRHINDVQHNPAEFIIRRQNTRQDSSNSTIR